MSADEERAVAGGTPSTMLLMKACSSITGTCLSSRTLRLDSSTQHSSEQNTASLIQKELMVADFLDRSIFDCRATLARRGKNNDGNETAVPTRQELRVKQQELLDESVRKQQERLLLSRIEMSCIAQDYMFPQQQQQQQSCTNRNGQQKLNHKSETLLVHQVIQSRDEQARLALNKIQQLQHVRALLQEADNESRRLQQENRIIWQQQQQQQVGSNNSGDTSASQASTDEATLSTTATAAAMATETRILKRALQDIIAGSELDWYADKRLRETIMKLEI